MNFFDQDYSKYFADFNALSGTEPFVQAIRKNIEAMSAAQKLLVEGAQAITKRQTDIVRRNIEQNADAVRKVAEASSPQEKMIQQADVARTSIERAISDARELSELVVKSQREALNIISGRVLENLEEYRGGLETAARKATTRK